MATIKATFIDSEDLRWAVITARTANWEIIHQTEGLYAHNLLYDSESRTATMLDVNDDDRASGDWRVHGADPTLDGDIVAMLTGTPNL